MITQKLAFNSKTHLAPLVEQLMKITHGPGEGAAVCLCLFIDLWHRFQPELTLDEIAEDARRMIMSYETDTLQ